jgi:proteasome regulatory subunit
VNFEELASRTDGASGADIKAICTEAGMFAIREDRTKVKMLDFTKGIDKVVVAEVDNIGEGAKMFA